MMDTTMLKMITSACLLSALALSACATPAAYNANRSDRNEALNPTPRPERTPDRLPTIPGWKPGGPGDSDGRPGEPNCPDCDFNGPVRHTPGVRPTKEGARQ